MWEPSATLNLLIRKDDKVCSSVLGGEKPSHISDEENTTNDIKVETVYGLDYRDSDRVDPRGDISQLMRFYVFIAFMVVSRLVWNVVKAHTGSDMFFSITHSSISESLESTLSIVYCGVIASHTAMLNKKYFGNYFGFVDEIADAFGSLPSPPRVKRSFLAITTSYLTSSLYLTVLVLAIMGINIILTENNIPKIPSTSFLWPFLYFLGFFLCTYQVFSVRTNLAMLVFWAQIMACRFLPTLFCGLVYNMNIASNSTRSGERVTGSSVISPLTVASTAFVETDTGSNLTTQDDQGSAGSNTRLASTDAPVGLRRVVDITTLWRLTFFAMVIVVMFFEDLVYMMGSAIISGLGHNLTLSLVHLYSLYFMPIAYYIIVENHSTTPKEDYTIIGFIDDDGSVDGTAGTLLSPPRVTYTKFWITMSYLKVNLYLVALYLAICSISNLLITRIGHLTLVVQYLPVILYLAGFSFYTYRVFNYRTNILLTVAMLFGIPAVLQDFYHFVVLGTAVLAISCHFLQYGGEIVSAVEETSGAAGGPVAFTSVTGTGSDA